jgi:hypothetical protein
MLLPQFLHLWKRSSQIIPYQKCKVPILRNMNIVILRRYYFWKHCLMCSVMIPQNITNS